MSCRVRLPAARGAGTAVGEAGWIRSAGGATLAGTGKTALAGGLGAQLAWLGAPGLPGLTGPGKDRARPQAAAGRRPDWAALARRLHGPLLRPGDRGYRAASIPYNQRYAGIHPQGVAPVRGTADVRTALAWARDNRVPFAVRSGGHSYAGYSTSDGLVISLARMNWVRVDRESLTIRLGPGALNRDLYAALAGTGVAAPGGRCPTVAVSGLLLGGGFGFSSRHMGLSCDQLLATEVVTACGDGAPGQRPLPPGPDLGLPGRRRRQLRDQHRRTCCGPPGWAGSRCTGSNGPGSMRPPRSARCWT